MFALIPALFAWFVCQLFKVLQGKKWCAVGGCPSSHSAFLSALSFSLYFYRPVFVLSLGLYLVVVHDALFLSRRHSLKDVVAGTFVGVFAAWVFSLFPV